MDESYISNQTEKLRKKYQLQDQYQFDLKTICIGEKIKASLQILEDDVDGFTDFNYKTPLVIINKNNSPMRQRFTLAHELGHYYLHFDHKTKLLDSAFSNNSTYFRQRFASKDPFEKEADLFAYNLLMPISLLEKELKDKRINDLTVKIVAEKFNVAEIDLFRWLNILDIA